MTIADFNIETITTETKSALDVHSNIIAAEQSAANAMLSLCENLKKMRDTGLFKSLGFDKFEDYTEQACNIKKRQAYNYIQTYERLGKSVMQSNAQLGITKLQLLTEVCAVERDDFIEKNDLDGMSVSEIKKLVEDNRHQGEQLSFLSDKVAKAENDSSEKDKCISELKAEIEQLRKQPVEVAVQEPSENDIQKAVAERTKLIEAELDKQKQQFQSELNEKVKSAKAAALKKAEKKQLEAIEKAKAEVEEKYDINKSGIISKEDLINVILKANVMENMTYDLAKSFIEYYNKNDNIDYMTFIARIKKDYQINTVKKNTAQNNLKNNVTSYDSMKRENYFIGQKSNRRGVLNKSIKDKKEKLDENNIGYSIIPEFPY